MPPAPRMLPPITDENRAYWTGGAGGRLLIQRCDACDRWVHPPQAACPACGGGPLTPAPVSGRGTVLTYTVNEHAFHPDVPPPYVIAVVTLDEQDDLRLPTNLVDCEPGDLRCGLPVEVTFEPQGDDVFVPVFRPA